jgi:hypothetical protein
VTVPPDLEAPNRLGRVEHAGRGMRSGFDSLYADSTRFGLGVAAGGKLSHRVGADVL